MTYASCCRTLKEPKEGRRPRQLEASRRALRRGSSTETLPADPEHAVQRLFTRLSRRPFALLVGESAILSMWLARFPTNSASILTPNSASNWPLILVLHAGRGIPPLTLVVSPIAPLAAQYLGLIAAVRSPN